MVCEIKLMPISLTFFLNSSTEISVRYAGMACNLSTVPPVIPKPRPLIFAIGTPKLARMGEIIKVTLSPTPPVLCLSTTLSAISRKSNFSPEPAIAMVSEKISSSVMPLMQIAISSAAAW